MKKVRLLEYEYLGTKLPNLNVIIDDEGLVVYVALLYGIYLKKANKVYSVKRLERREGYEIYLQASQISDSTAKSYMSCLFRFCKYVNEQSKLGKLRSVHSLYDLSNTDINEYINESLPVDLGEQSLNLHFSALRSFFNFLTFLSIKPLTDLYLSHAARQKARENNAKKAKINYITKSERFELIIHCSNHRDRLLMKLGSEVGLRASENRGLLLSYNGEEKGYLKDLFKQLDSEEFNHKNEFGYLLSGKFTKGGKSRTIFFTRSLLREMKEYYDGEREQLLVGMEDDRVDSEHLLINTKGKNKGYCISARLPSDVFSECAKKLKGLSPKISYHDLRHTFATELYHDELLDDDGSETRSESAALIVVAERLGHSMGKDGSPSSVTIRYIRLRSIMQAAEGWT